MRRDDFPQLSGKLIYFDSAATTCKPLCVIDALGDFYKKHNVNVRRGLYTLSYEAGKMYDDARDTVAKFIGAEQDEIIFTRGATESLNMVARGLHFERNDEIVIGITEHHSNMLPWRETGAKIRYLYCEKTGEYKQDQINSVITNKTRLVAITAYSNILGRNLQLEKIIRRAREVGAIVVIDAAQAIAHERINIKSMDADFLAFSGHKIYGPMGIGVLYGKMDLLEKLEPMMFGGEMVDDVSIDAKRLAKIPERFEAGTMNVAGAVGLARALDYLNENNFGELLSYEQDLCDYAFNKMSEIPYLELAGARTLNHHSTVLCFWLQNVHPHDISAFLDSCNIAIRAGFQCAQPLVEYIGKGPVARVSISFYNTFEEVDLLCDLLRKIRGVLKIK